MAFDWEHVEAIRAEQNSARARHDINTLPTGETSERIYNSPTGIDAKVPKLDHWEQMIQKVRTQLIDYIISHGLVQGFEYDGIDEPIKNGKIVLTADMLKRVTDRFGYFREKETREFIEQYLPEHFYVADENYVHTDNNYTDAEKAKLEGIADGAEVNKVISILFNGVESIDPETRVATITITPADVKTWYEQNPDTNVFTDAEKAKLESIDIDALSNKVEDVTIDGETVVKNKIAVLTAKKIKDSYESNPDTNAFTDADKAFVEQVLPEVQKGVNQHEQRIDALEDSQSAQDAEIADAKNSISELGDEVNSVAGRVTNLESSQKTQDGKISALEQKNTEQDERLNALETSDTTQNADILQLKEDVKNAGKVDDVQVDGTSVVEDKIAKIPKVYTEKEIQEIVNALVAQGYVPYTGATKNVDLGGNAYTSGDSGSGYGYTTMSSEGFSIEAPRINGSTKVKPGFIQFDNGNYAEILLDEGYWGNPRNCLLLTNLGGASFVNMAGADPVEEQDFTTKKYVDDGISALTQTFPKLLPHLLEFDSVLGQSVQPNEWIIKKESSSLPTPPTGKQYTILTILPVVETYDNLVCTAWSDSANTIYLGYFNPTAEAITPNKRRVKIQYKESNKTNS